MAVTTAREGAILIVTLDAPERLNAMTTSHSRRLAKIWTAAAGDDDVRAIVLCGAGDRAFSVGADLKSMTASAPATVLGPVRDRRAERDVRMWKPTIAAARGHVVGGGATLFLAAHLRVVGSDVRLSLPEARWGLPVGVRRHFASAALASELQLIGDVIGADQLLRAGLANRVVAPADVVPTALELARTVARRDPVCTAAIIEAHRSTPHRRRHSQLPSALTAREPVRAATSPQRLPSPHSPP
jgi:enoyl-CoA hydratase/carnithine racemase